MSRWFLPFKTCTTFNLKAVPQVHFALHIFKLYYCLARSLQVFPEHLVSCIQTTSERSNLLAINDRRNPLCD